MMKKLFEVKPLRWAPLWITVGLVIVMMFIYLSLVKISLPQISGLTSIDKIMHFTAYFVITSWFCQILARLSGFVLLGIFLAMMGIGIELLQGMTGYRSFEWYDMLANTTGIIAALLLNITAFGSLLYGIEQFFHRQKYRFEKRLN